MWSLAEIQLRPSGALTCTVTLSCGAAAMALSDGSGFGSAGLLILGLAETGDLPVVGVEPSATFDFAPSPELPLIAVKPTKPITATIAATMAAVQFGPRRSGRIRSASKSGAAGVGAGRPPCSAS